VKFFPQGQALDQEEAGIHFPRTISNLPFGRVLLFFDSRMHGNGIDEAIISRAQAMVDY